MRSWHAECSALPHTGCNNLRRQEPVAQFPAGAGCSSGSWAQKASPAFSSTKCFVASRWGEAKNRDGTLKTEVYSYTQPTAFSVRLRVLVTRMLFLAFLLEFCSGCFGFFFYFIFVHTSPFGARQQPCFMLEVACYSHRGGNSESQCSSKPIRQIFEVN